MITFKEKFKYSLQGAGKSTFRKSSSQPGSTTEDRVTEQGLFFKELRKARLFSDPSPHSLDEIKLHLIYFSKIFPHKIRSGTQGWVICLNVCLSLSLWSGDQTLIDVFISTASATLNT